MGKAAPISKKDMQKKIRDLVDVIEANIGRYHDLLDIERVSKDLGVLTKYKVNLLKLAKIVENLPENKPTLEELSQGMPSLDEAFANYNRIPSHIVEFEGGLNRTVARLEPLVATILETPTDLRLSVYGKSIEASFHPPSFPEIYLKDKKLKESNYKLDVQKRGFAPFLEKHAQEIKNLKSEQEKTKLFISIKKVLDMMREAHKGYAAELKERAEQIKATEEIYHKAVSHKNELINKIKRLLDQVEQHTNLSGLAELCLRLHKEITQLSKNRDPLNSSSSTTDLVADFAAATKTCKEDSLVLQNKLDELFSKLAQHAQKEKQNQQQLEQQREQVLEQLEKQCAERLASFYYFYQEYLPKAENSKPLADLQESFDKCYKQNPRKHSDSITAAKAKLEQLTTYVERLKEEITKQEKELCQQLKKKIEELVAQTKKNSRIILAELKKAKFDFDEEEQALIASIPQKAPSSYKEVELSSSLLESKLQEALEKMARQEKAIHHLKEILAVHKQAKELSQQNNFDKFVEAMNKTAQPQTLLVAISRYGDASFLDQVKANLDCFNPAGLEALTQFLKGKEGRLIAEINKKLQFIKLASDKELDYRPYINDSQVVDTVHYLNTKELEDLISQKALENRYLLDALSILERYKIPLSAKKVNELINEPGKCELIKQQLTLNNNLVRLQSAEAPLNKPLFQELLIVILNSEERVTNALNNLQKQNLNLCPPWLILACRTATTQTETEKKGPQLLIEILEHKANLTSNGLILQALFYKEGPNQTRLRSYLQGKYAQPQSAQDALAELDKFLGEDIGELLKQLAEAQKASHTLTMAAKVIDVISNFTRNYKPKTGNFGEIRASMQSFNLKSMGILLKADNFKNKEEDVKCLAKKIFKHQHKNIRILADVLQCISFAFIVVMPLRYYAFNTHPLFSQAKTQRQKELENRLSQTEQKSSSDHDSVKESGTIEKLPKLPRP